MININNQEDEISNYNNKGLRKKDFFMLGFGSMIGIGWTVAINEWFKISGGPIGAAIAFLIGTFMIIPIGLAYAEMASSIPLSGGVIAYGYKGINKRMSFVGGWFVMLAYIILLPWEAIYINKILLVLFPGLKALPPIYSILGHDIYPLGLLVTTLLSLLMIYINLKGAKSSGKLQTVFTSMIMISAAIVIVFSLINGNLRNLKPIYSQVEGYEHDNIIKSILSMIVIVPFFLSGFDAVSQSIEEAKSDKIEKSIGRILIMSILAAGIFYIMIILSAGYAIDWRTFSELDSPSVAIMFKYLYGDSKLGDILYYLTMIGALSGLLSTWNAMFLSSSRLMQSMGKVKLISPKFKELHPVYKTPVNSIRFAGIASIIGPFLGIGLIKPLTNVGSLSFIIGWLITSLSALRLRELEPDLKRPYKAGNSKLILTMATLISTLLIFLLINPFLDTFMGYISLTIFGVWSLLGLIFYYYSFNIRNSISEKKRLELFNESLF